MNETFYDRSLRLIQENLELSKKTIRFASALVELLDGVELLEVRQLTGMDENDALKIMLVRDEAESFISNKTNNQNG